MHKISFSLGSTRLLAGGLLTVLTMLTSAPATAADAKASGQVRGLQQRLRAAEQDKSKLVQDKAELDAQVKDATDKLTQSKRSADTATRQKSALVKELDAATADKSALAGQLAAAETRLAELEAKLAESGAGYAKTAALLQRSDVSNRQLGETLAQRDQTLAECSVKNESLYGVGASLLAQFEAHGSGNPLEREPVTKVLRVALENRVEAYREQLEQQQFGLQAQARHDASQRQVAQRQLEQERLAGEQARQGKSELERHQLAKLRQQTDLDRLTRTVRSLFDNLEW